jgi:hypothetical protein
MALASMKPASKALFIGAIVSIIGLFWFWWQARADRLNYANLVTQCKEENQKAMPPLDHPSAKFFVEYACSKGEASKIDYQYRRPIEREFAYAETGTGWLSDWSLFASAIMLISAIPFAWRFLLDRIAELSRAIRGQR